MEQRPVENGQLGAKNSFFHIFFDFFLDFFWRYQNYSYLCTRNQEMIDASLAQLVEHDTLNVGVQGSSPWGGTKEKDPILIGSFSFFSFPDSRHRRNSPNPPGPARISPQHPIARNPNRTDPSSFASPVSRNPSPEKKKIRVRIAAPPAPSTFRAPRAGLRSMHASDNRRKIYRRV